jgi:hypothetical protein
MVENPPVLVVVLNASPLISLLFKISHKSARILRNPLIVSVSHQ